MMHLRKDFRDRLSRLSICIDRVLTDDINQPEHLKCSVSYMIPFVFRLYSYLWMKRVSDLIKK